jgi:hypothetical protein
LWAKCGHGRAVSQRPAVSRAADAAVADSPVLPAVAPSRTRKHRGNSAPSLACVAHCLLLIGAPPASDCAGKRARPPGRIGTLQSRRPPLRLLLDQWHGASRAGWLLTLHQHDAVLFAARRQAETTEFQTVYRIIPADGRAQHRLDRPRQPQIALSRHHQKRLVASSTRSRGKPSPAHHPRFGPHQRCLDHPGHNMTGRPGRSNHHVRTLPAPTIPKDPPAPSTTAYPRHP